MDRICSRVYDFLRARAAWKHNGLVHADVEEIVVTLRDRYPSDRRATFGEVHHAIQILKLRHLIIGCRGRWKLVQRAQGSGSKSPPTPT